MARAWIFRLAVPGVVMLVTLCANSPTYAWDAAQGARDSIIQSVRDDVRRHIQSREQRFRNSRAEFRNRSVMPAHKARVPGSATLPKQ